MSTEHELHLESQMANYRDIIALQKESISILKSSNGDLKDAIDVLRNEITHRDIIECNRVMDEPDTEELRAQIKRLEFTNDHLRDMIGDVSSGDLRDAFTAGVNCDTLDHSSVTVDEIIAEYEKWAKS